MMHIIGQIIFGLIIGAIAQLLVAGNDPGSWSLKGFAITCVIGVIGSLLGTLIGRALWGGEKYSAGWIMSIVGAILLLLLYRMFPVFG